MATSFTDSVIIADDHHISLDLLKGIIISLGYSKIRRYKDGKAALDGYKAETSDILFLDINMPELSGLEMLKEIRSLNPDAFIVIISGESSASNIKESLTNGAQGFVVKPFRAERIKDVLDKYQKIKLAKTTT